MKILSFLPVTKVIKTMAKTPTTQKLHKTTENPRRFLSKGEAVGRQSQASPRDTRGTGQLLGPVGETAGPGAVPLSLHQKQPSPALRPSGSPNTYPQGCKSSPEVNTASQKGPKEGQQW